MGKLENYHVRKTEGKKKTEQHKNMKISNSKGAIIQKPQDALRNIIPGKRINFLNWILDSLGNINSIEH